MQETSSNYKAEQVSQFKDNVLDGKVALITGGGTGIGLGIAKEFGLHGACVSLMGRRAAVLDEAVSVLRAQGIRAMRVLGDVRDADSCEAAVRSTLQSFGGHLDILVNSAAGNFLCRAQDLTPNGFKTVMEIDAGGVFNMSHFCFSALKASGGSIINISANLQYGATWYQAHPSAAKSAIDSLTRSLALEWGSEGIRVNGVAPGPIGGTAGMEKLSGGGKGGTDWSQSVPLGRMGDTREVAMACVFLASEAGSYITGSVLVVDGGHRLYKEPIIPPAEVAKVSRKLETSARNIGRASQRSRL